MAAPATQTRPYRDFLTPSLHRRFTDASGYTIALCYFIALWMGEWNNFLDIWSWFPIGPAGIRTLLLFIPALAIYILRVAQWHVGQRNTENPFNSFKKYFFRKSTFSTIAFYTISAWFYSEVYVWTRSSRAQLQYTDNGKHYDRIKLNERPLYFRFMFIALAIAQATVHLWKDYDKINVPGLKPKKERKEESPATESAARSVKLSRELVQKVIPVGAQIGIVVSVTLLAGTAVYFAVLRNYIWDWHYGFAKRLVSLSRTSKPTGLVPYLPLVGMFLVQGTLLTTLWEFANKTFDLYVSQEPLKKDNPITNDSKDPNGSLLNGLKSKKDDVKAIAFWELALITENFLDRRTTIYGELDRKKAPTYLQVTEICLAELRFIIRRISAVIDPNYVGEEVDSKKTVPTPISLIPQISQPIKEGQIKGPRQAPVTPFEQIEYVASNIARSHSSSQNAQNAQMRQVLKKGQEKAAQGAKEIESAWTVWSNKLTSSVFGWPFRVYMRRIAIMVVTGAPYSRISLISNAVTALTNLTVHSLTEDTWGQFQNQVPDIVRVFTAAIHKIDEYVATLQVHWSDVDSLSRPESERKKIPEVEEVREVLREGLERILGAFNEYLRNLGMSVKDLSEAKKAIVRQTQTQPEVEQVRR
ncbi:nucleoporin protein Ndc1-Nup [Massariosphaeria phaeospora]|uniref:Nucleoporin protein Ndc1-Nup n=1 Tax=Massariosphaeria phaeospora TaxID=100035 RepID=A0A7C8IEW2_9PLEO|nr:nucleoporin protein Ndc1-Nup [Massariosphaeria phaeospora]